MILNAYAKINLSLDITGKRDNGYHDLDSVMQSISLCDKIEITKNRTGEIQLSCSKITLPTDEHNIAYKTAELFREHFKIEDFGVNIHMVKNIPVEAGLGGGSADAAAVLRGMVDIFKVETNETEMLKLATKIGADVPFCLVRGTKRCKGIGEVMTNLPPMPKCKILICKPPVGVSTKKAYEVSDNFPHDNFFGTAAMVKALRSGDLNEVAQAVSNRFDDVLIIPEVTIIKAFMMENGAVNASMSGSGSAVFGIFADEELATRCGKQLKDLGEVILCEPLN